jgi:hypothetical protein
MDIRVTVEPEPRAIARSAWYQARAWVQWVRGVGLALAVVALWAFLTPGWWPIGVIAVGGGIAYQFDPWLRIRRHVKDPGWASHGPLTYTFTEQGVGFSSAIQTNQTVWRGFTKVVDTGDDLMLTMAKRRVVAVPREAFADGELEELTAFLSGQGLLAGRKR